MLPRTLETTLASAALALLTIACSPYNPDLGDLPFRCGQDEPRCPDGYVCDESGTPAVCRSEGQASGADARPSSGDGGNLSCNDDSQLEPNDSITDPTITPIPDFGPDYELVALAICPDTDVDVFRFRIDVTGKNATVDVTYNSTRGTLVLDILNSTGVSIRQGAPAGGNNDVLRAEVANLPSGVYYARVGGAAGATNNYSISIKTTGP
jgi:hypothetical protein